MRKFLRDVLWIFYGEPDPTQPKRSLAEIKQDAIDTQERIRRRAREFSESMRRKK